MESKPALDPAAVPPPPAPARKRSFFAKDRPWLHLLLLLVTFASCAFVGINLSVNWLYAEQLSRTDPVELSAGALTSFPVISLSLIYALVLILILSAHEMGHYLACRHYRVDATLPFFIPAPTLIGTMGAFIKIRSPISRKHQLFDIGAAGPLAGFALALPALIYGLSISKTVAPLPRADGLFFGEPLLLKAFAAFFFRNQTAPFDIMVHPIAFAGWVGILVTALNLFPVGQLDGGHILYAVIGRRTRRTAPVFMLVFLVMGVMFWVGWLVWALLISLLGTKHPPVFDESLPLSKGRQIVACTLLVIFILAFIPAPVVGYNLFDVFAQFTAP